MGSPTVVVNGATANKFMSNEFILVGLGQRPCLVFSNRCWKVCLSPPVDVHGIKFPRAKKARDEIQKALVGEIRRKKEAMESGGQEGDGMLFSKLVPAYIRGEITEEEVLRTAYITHYDKKGFPDPMSFNPNQFADLVQSYAFIPFGGGPRLCEVHLQNTLSEIYFMRTFISLSNL
ncbi:putative protopanaxadiol 6-hydroxylase [Helianthus annuus]|nr:putative protopanaxadiol 6-hydroxylase [Helianthus annuus]